MFDKTIKLTEPYPSDFKPTMSVMEIQKHFSAFGFEDARMLAGAKWDYTEEHEGDLIVFNANVLMSGYGKVWFGDLNLTEEIAWNKKKAYQFHMEQFKDELIIIDGKGKIFFINKGFFVESKNLEWQEIKSNLNSCGQSSPTTTTSSENDS